MLHRNCVFASGTDMTKGAPGHVMLNLSFCIRWNLGGHVVYSGSSRTSNVDTLFLMLGWDQYGYDKIRTWTRYAKLLFLHLVGSTGHVVHSGASGARNVTALFFKLGWARCSLPKKHEGTSYDELVFLHPMGSAGHLVHFGASVARNINALLFILGKDSTDMTKRAPGHITPKLCFRIRWDLRVT
jgi:hypothetical protein